jgi:hypothetical protein
MVVRHESPEQGAVRMAEFLGGCRPGILEDTEKMERRRSKTDGRPLVQAEAMSLSLSGKHHQEYTKPSDPRSTKS